MADTIIEALDEIGSTPLDLITADQTADVVWQVLRRDADDAVDVARFGSSI